MFENKSAKETLLELDVDESKGLSNEEVRRRQEKYGFNKLAEKKKKPLILVFLSQFNDPMIFILFAAAILSLAISIYSLNSPNVESPELIEIISDPAIILGVCILNATIGTVQENKAEKSLEALKNMASPTCLVKREGVIVEIKAEELVPGDIVILEEGRTVPADLRIISSINLKTDESSLTGESLPVEKQANVVFSEEVGVGDRVNIAYMSTPVVYGRGEGVVILTGMNTETGKIAAMLSDDEDQTTPLQKKLAELSKFLGILTIVIVVALFLVQMIDIFFISRIPSSEYASAITTDFMFAISLAVAAVPEGLPAVVTIVLALGVQRMVRANTIVRKLPSVETLGAVSTVCSDKTGTLTQNKMTVVRAYFDGKIYNESELLDDKLHALSLGMSLCSNASTDEGLFGDPTEIALVEFANKHEQRKKLIEEKYPRIDELPFDSNRKMMSTLHSNKIMYTKGALDSILRVSTMYEVGGKSKPLTEADKKAIMDVSDTMAKDALRVLALAYKKTDSLSESDLIFVGLVGMIDPPRPEARDAVSIFKKAGITTIMITGDHKTTALAIAKDLGIAEDESQAMSGSEIDQLTPEQLQEKVKTIRIFARVSPENKVSIVKAIKANGQIAAMTGDGVNDAPSLKSADIGIAMGITGTDVAKGAADMILTDDNFASIEKAVEEGRGIYTNIKKTVLFLLGSNIAEVLTMFSIVICGLFTTYTIPTPLLSVHVLWVNLITDALPAVALGADEKEANVMSEQPRDPKESLFSHGGFIQMLGYGIVITLATVAAFLFSPVIASGGNWDIFWLLDVNGGNYASLAQTCAFCVLSMSELFHMLGMTSRRRTVFHVFRTKNKLIWISFLIGMLLQVLVVITPGLNTFFQCQPLEWQYWLLVVLLSLSPLVVHEIVVLVLLIKSKIKKNK